jgi:hypothetical protein
MEDIVDDKALFQGLPVYEGDNADVDASTDTHKRQQIHGLRRVVAVFGVMALLLELFSSGWNGSHVLKAGNN